ncbi:alpha/beta hydrolase-fold protein [Tunturiibacter empetritectus]|uniref:Enterochelin esterase-like enzyme n=2 Tax=Tunturiibacter TaxID=3154218 RepID=A0A852VHH0_9BACT|nr:alpha/beta hydrolase-fold protein [Edaphobacter lichenicola]NYF92258.1 enterochelin esterase-like enzyme [Edaphobacter lichenicola]
MAPEFHGPFDPVELSDPELEHDGLRHLTFHSPALRGRGDVSLFIPRGSTFPAELPLVLLLHGVYGSHWAWFLKGAAHRTAQDLIDRGEIRPMLLAAPSDGLSGDGSGYWPMPGRDAEAWIAHDVPACIREKFSSHGPTFLCGLSMGGYGALRIGFKYSDRFRGISTHSSITHAEQMHNLVRDRDLNLSAMPVYEHDILHWARKHRDQLPAVRFDCGTDDSLFNASAILHRELDNLSIPHTYETFPGGHEWSYWRQHIESTLRFFHSLLSK